MAATTWSSQLYESIKRYAAVVLRRYKKLSLTSKLFLWLLALFYMCLAVLIYFITPARVAQYLYDKAQLISNLPFGWLIFFFVILLVSFPPMTGHTTVVTLCGFAYGVWGFFLAAAGSLVGAMATFVVLRFLFSERMHNWTSNNKKWQALEAVVRAKGLPLMILIRISPFPPWVYSNTLFASIEAVHLWQFAVATCFQFPKYLLYVFIGSRMAALSDGDQREHMDTQTKIANAVIVIGGIVLGVIASLIVFRLVQRHIRGLEGIPPDVDELAAEAIEDINEDAPLLRSFSQDSPNSSRDYEACP